MRAVALLLALALAGAACSRQTESGSGELVVLAAASLTGAFQALEAAFEKAYPNTDVLISYAGSQTLAMQLREGAGADVIALADASMMEELAREGLVVEALPLATNRLVWLLAPSLPEAAAGSNATPLDGEFLRREGVRLVLAAAEVPVGSYARQALRRMKALDAAEARLVSTEADVRGVVGKMRAGEADAALVYTSDALPNLRGDAVVRELPADAQVVAHYAIAVVTRSPHAARARDFVAFVLEAPGLATLRALGFATP
jgi:molybdate transport system substrate-binding protein